MEIILAKTCQSLTGSLNRQHGYFIRQQGQRFFGQRCPNNRWPKGHLSFILDLAKMANGLIVSDIRVPADELRDALDEAGRQDVKLANEEYNANTVEHLRVLWNLDRKD